MEKKLTGSKLTGSKLTGSKLFMEEKLMGRTRLGEDLMDRMTLGVFGMLSGRLGKRTAREQFEKNREAWEAHDVPSYVEHQPELTWLRYGRATALEKKLFFGGRELTAAENACEVIAVYNALLALRAGQEKSGQKRAHITLPELLFRFSQKGICAKGVFGTSPRALERYFREHGYRAASCRGGQITEEALAGLQEAYDVFIMTAFNKGQDPFSMVHTMCITRDGEGFRRHNDYAKPQYYATLSGAVRDYRGGRGHALFVLAVGKP